MHQQIEIFIKNFNDSWTKGKIESIKPLLNENVIFMAPDMKSEIKGKENCIKTIIDYVNNGETFFFEVTEKRIHIWAETAMITIDYYVEYKMNDQFHKENGKEFWTLINDNGCWQLVWRAMITNEKNK